MATKKDLVEAYSFSRRRLVTAFVSGAPGGREVEPTRPGRTIVGGVALAVLLVAGAAVLGILKSPTTIDWDQEGLVSEKETSANYLVLAGDDGETELRPLANITSAMLILGSDVTANRVPRDEIAERDRGAPIGILDAPNTPPDEGMLVQSGWSACTGVLGSLPVGIQVHLGSQPDTVPTPDVAFVVRTTDDRLFLVAESTVGASRGVPRAYAYPVPASPTVDGLLLSVAGTNAGGAVRVPDEWITLFPTGAPLALASFGVRASELDEPWPFRDTLTGAGARRAQIGDLLRVDDQLSVMTRQGTVVLDAFSAAVFANLADPEGDPTATYPAMQTPPGSSSGIAQLPDVNWPQEVMVDQRPAGQLCAQLDTPGGEPGVVLATTAIDSDASAADVPAGDVDVTVDSGHGAFVQSGDWDDEGPSSPVLVDDRGYEYPVGTGDERTNLGYGDVAPVIVPQDWIELFEIGVPLTIDAARCPPTSQPERSSCST